MGQNLSKRNKSEGLRALINALKERPLGTEELRSALSEKLPLSQGGARRRVERYLKDLVSLGLVLRNADGTYRWYRYDAVFSSRTDYMSMWQHSKLLIPALRMIGGIRVEPSTGGYGDYGETSLSIRFAEEHLKAHEALANQHEEVLDADHTLEERNKNLLESVEIEFRSRFPQRVDLVKGTNSGRPFVGDTIPGQVCRELMRQVEGNVSEPEFISELDGTLKFQRTVVARGSKYGLKVRKFIERELSDASKSDLAKNIGAARHKAFEAQRRLQEGIRILILNIESGGTLLGRCPACPNVTIQP